MVLFAVEECSNRTATQTVDDISALHVTCVDTSLVASGHFVFVNNCHAVAVDSFYFCFCASDSVAEVNDSFSAVRALITVVRV